MSATQGMDLIVHLKLTSAFSSVLHSNDNEMMVVFTSQISLVADDSEPEQDFVFWPCRETYFKQQAFGSLLYVMR